MGDQWREDESKLFERYNKIPMMANKLGMLYNHLIGYVIQNTPNLQISPDGNVPVETAQVRAALVKNISLNSDAKTIYQNSYGQAVIGGFGAARVGTDYVSDDTDEQEIKIYGFEDPNRCYWDLAAKHPCKVDGMFSGYKTRVSRQWFRDKFGKDIESQIGTTAVTEDSTVAFADDDSITIVDDFERVVDSEDTAVYKLSDGNYVNGREFKELERIPVDPNNKKSKKILLHNNVPVTVVSKRERVVYNIKHKQIAGDFVLEETDFPGKKLLPILFLDQDSYYTKQGQQITRSYFKDVKDLQKYLNYLFTQSCYIMKISRYDQFIMPRKCAASPDAQQQWRDPSVVNGALYYDETPSGAKPEQLQPPLLSPSLLQQYQQTLMDIQSGTGIFDTQMGEHGNETSGKAIIKRNRASNKTTQKSRTSLEIMVATIGEIVNEMIPNVYDTERVLTLPMPDSQEEKISINKPLDDYGLGTMNDMTQGRYKIRLKPGLSSEEQKEEALDSLQSVLMADKGGSVFPMIADLYAENLPIDNNMEIRNRLRTMVPPEIIEAGKTGKPLPPKPPQPNPEMMMMELKKQELQQRAEAAQQEAARKMQELELKRAEIQRKALETHQDMTLQWERLEAERQEAAAELQESLLRYQGEAQRIGADLQINHSQNLIKLLTHTPKEHHHTNKTIPK
jgi:hypothetical protein